jgi:hypothetical protein
MAKKEVAILTPTEVEIVQAAQDDPSIYTDYFFRPAGADKGFIFDENFTEDGKWQVEVHSATQTDITVIGGFGTGKTLGVGMSAAVWGGTTADFAFLNAAQRSWQSKQMYDKIIQMARNTRFDDLIFERPRKPHPKLVIKFKIGDVVYESTMEFMSADKQATGILSWEGDWLNIEEAGLLDDLEEVMTSTGSRLRGSIKGRERLARFSMISNSWENPTLWYYFDLAQDYPDDYLSIVVGSQQNKNVTRKQLERMLRRIPRNERKRFILGTRPEGKGAYFDKQSVYACEQEVLGEDVEEKVARKIPGYYLEEQRGAGVTFYAVPPIKNRLYYFLGDPGTGGPPHRDAPVWMGWDVTRFPQVPAKLIFFWWGHGGGKIFPFVNMFRGKEGIYPGFKNLYYPELVAIDSTGPQKHLAHLVNELVGQAQELSGDGKLNEPLWWSPLGPRYGMEGLDFSGSKKSTYLRSGQLFIENQNMIWPKSITGIRAQLTNYDLDRDKHIAQDIVATLAMSAFAIRKRLYDPEGDHEEAGEQAPVDPYATRRTPVRDRSRRSESRLPIPR